MQLTATGQHCWQQLIKSAQLTSITAAGPHMQLAFPTLTCKPREKADIFIMLFGHLHDIVLAPVMLARWNLLSGVHGALQASIEGRWWSSVHEHQLREGGGVVCMSIRLTAVRAEAERDDLQEHRPAITPYTC
jgi:hypothetical protein